MSAAFSKDGIWQLYVPGRPGQDPVQRSTGTRNIRIRNQMRRMLRELKSDREWEILDALRESPPRLTLGQVYDAWSNGRLAELKSRLSAVNLVERLDEWTEWVRAELGDTGTADLYRQQVETLIGEGPFYASDLTLPWLKKRLATLKVTTGTRRKYYYALRSLMRFLFDAGVLTSDPFSFFRAPKKNPKRVRWESEANDLRIVNAADRRYKALFAFIKATGADVSAALRTLRRDLDLERSRVQIRGTKTAKRNVHEAEIEPWAIPFLREHAKGLLPNAPLWPAAPKRKAGSTGRYIGAGYTRHGAGHHHDRICALLAIEDYTLKDARHSWAVRARRFRGYTWEQIAEQLGNSAYQVATVYAAFKPDEAAKEASDG